jgi:hypothetical protein
MPARGNFRAGLFRRDAGCLCLTRLFALLPENGIVSGSELHLVPDIHGFLQGSAITYLIRGGSSRILNLSSMRGQARSSRESI